MFLLIRFIYFNAYIKSFINNIHWI